VRLHGADSRRSGSRAGRLVRPGMYACVGRPAAILLYNDMILYLSNRAAMSVSRKHKRARWQPRPRPCCKLSIHKVQLRRSVDEGCCRPICLPARHSQQRVGGTQALLRFGSARDAARCMIGLTLRPWFPQSILHVTHSEPRQPCQRSTAGLAELRLVSGLECSKRGAKGSWCCQVTCPTRPRLCCDRTGMLQSVIAYRSILDKRVVSMPYCISLCLAACHHMCALLSRVSAMRRRLRQTGMRAPGASWACRRTPTK